MRLMVWSRRKIQKGEVAVDGQVPIRRDETHGELQLVVIGKFRAKDQDSPTRVKRVFQDYSVKLFRTSELPQLIDEIRTTGKDFGPTV
jgi:hypothetical protein